MWLKFILLFAAVWMIQVIMTQLQARHFRQKFKEMCAVTDSGYLGVGVHKPRFGVGSVVILVADKQLRIIKAVHMTGVTVFAKFKPLPELIRKPLHTLPEKADKALMKAIVMAGDRIESQIQEEGVMGNDRGESPPVHSGEQVI